MVREQTPSGAKLYLAGSGLLLSTSGLLLMPLIVRLRRLIEVVQGRRVKLKSTTREKIIDRAIYLIGKRGTTNVSVRDIAKEADVNVAAINYYFDSKERLLSLVEERFIEATVEVLDGLKDEQIPPQERLLKWCDLVMQYLLDYPGVLLLVDRWMSAPDRGSFGDSLAKAFEVGFISLKELLSQVGVTDDDAVLSFKATMIVSALATPAAMFSGSLFQKDMLRDAETRHRFLELLVEMVSK